MPRLTVLFVLSVASSPCPDLNLIHYNSMSQNLNDKLIGNLNGNIRAVISAREIQRYVFVVILKHIFMAGSAFVFEQERQVTFLFHVLCDCHKRLVSKKGRLKPNLRFRRPFRF